MSMFSGIVLGTSLAFFFALTLFELGIFGKVRPIRDLIIRKPIWGIVFSLCLALLAMRVFGAGGLIIMMASIMTTTFTGVIYFIIGIMVKRDSFRNIREGWEEIRPLFVITAKIIAFPFVVVGFVLRTLARVAKALTPQEPAKQTA